MINPETLKAKLKAGQQLRVKLGIDPTTLALHLGHIVPLRMLKAFQNAGHRAILIIGDFTAEIGDPAGRSIARRQLTSAEVKVNERTYRAQVGRVLDLRKTEVLYNSQWLSRLKLKDFLNLLAKFSLKSAWQRADFQKRLKSGREVHLHEAMYHVLQAYDSVMVKADVEIGSLDQRLNILAGRELQEKMGGRGQDVVLLPYLIGLDGKQKMSKSVGNTINLGDSADEMFGKTMSVPDDLIINYAALAAWLPAEKVKAMEESLKKGVNPRDVKFKVAWEIVKLYYGQAGAEKAGQHFVDLFSKKKMPRDLKRAGVAAGFWRPVDLLLRLKAAESKSAARRLISGKALEIDGRVIDPAVERVKLQVDNIIRVGRKKFFRVD